MDDFLNKVTKSELIFILMLIFPLFAMGKTAFAFGILLGAAWSLINIIMTVNLLRIAILKKSKSKLWVFLLIKFPVLYLAGGLILFSRVFSLLGLFIGVFSVFLIAGVVRLCLKPTPAI
ncbi:MAG: hypothetical protein PHO70_05320 [Candidatus Omnitrophica bacterium]|nr:hypothetical protein [Candidatus Omnitrophota bacterium]